jgi:hypothetical protein
MKPKRFARGRRRRPFNDGLIMPDTKRLVLPLLLLVALGLAGCSSAAREARAERKKDVALEVEESFRQRWIEQRAAALVNRGVSPDLARAQAIEEFRLNYGYTRAGEK